MLEAITDHLARTVTFWEDTRFHLLRLNIVASRERHRVLVQMEDLLREYTQLAAPGSLPARASHEESLDSHAQELLGLYELYGLSNFSPGSLPARASHEEWLDSHAQELLGLYELYGLSNFFHLLSEVIPPAISQHLSTVQDMKYQVESVLQVAQQEESNRFYLFRPTVLFPVGSESFPLAISMSHIFHQWLGYDLAFATREKNALSARLMRDRACEWTLTNMPLQQNGTPPATSRLPTSSHPIQERIHLTNQLLSRLWMDDHTNLTFIWYWEASGSYTHTATESIPYMWRKALTDRIAFALSPEGVDVDISEKFDFLKPWSLPPKGGYKEREADLRFGWPPLRERPFCARMHKMAEDD
jgi:hypothetical protein